MRRTKTKTTRSPAVAVESEPLGPAEQTSGWQSSVPSAIPLESIVGVGARAMRQMALDQEVQDFHGRYADRVDTQAQNRDHPL